LDDTLTREDIVAGERKAQVKQRQEQRRQAKKAQTEFE
jgi:hypothetical protein